MDRKVGSDAELARRARKGDLNAFDRLIARHRVRLHGIAREITSDREAAQDVLQESLVRAFRSLASLRQNDRVGQWLNTIVRRQAQQWLRDGHRRPEPVDMAEVRGVPAIWDATPEPPSEIADLVREALVILTERERRAMILHYLEGRSCEEIAPILKITTGSVKRILHYSRRKVREECEAMTAATEVKVGPRKLVSWSWGDIKNERYSPFRLLGTSLAQTICLAVNKRAKTVQQIANEVAAHAQYVEETVASLVEMDVLISPQKGKYIANFIAFEAGDYRRLMKLVREPAGEVAKRLAAAERQLRAAFEKCPLAASGWAWSEVIWVVYSVLVANAAAMRSLSPEYRPPRPHHPGGRYWLSGYEEVPDMAPVWNIGFNSSGPFGTLNEGYFWVLALPREHTGFGPLQKELLDVLSETPLAEEELLARLGEEVEQSRGAIAEMMQAGFVAKSDGRYRLMIPVLTQSDSDLLTPVVDAVIAPILKEVAEPATQSLNSLLDEMGYGQRRDQYSIWHGWLISFMEGEALRFLMEQGVLPRPPDPAPPTFGFLAWKGDLPLMSWGGDQ